MVIQDAGPSKDIIDKIKFLGYDPNTSTGSYQSICEFFRTKYDVDIEVTRYDNGKYGFEIVNEYFDENPNPPGGFYSYYKAHDEAFIQAFYEISKIILK